VSNINSSAPSGSVSVINVAGNAVVATIPVGSRPKGVAFSPSGALAYVANGYTNDVSVIDTTTRLVVATITGLVADGTTDRWLAITPDGSRLYVTNLFSGKVSVIDTSTRSVIATLSVGSIVSGIAASPMATPITGTISVSTNLPAATFTITGPATYTGGGTSFTQPNAQAGTYTITYGAPNCFATPVSETKTLTAGGTVSFTGGIYQGQANISVNVSPAEASGATFSISPPVPGMRNISPYPVIQPNVVPQTYTVTFNQLGGFGSPQPQTLAPDSSCRLPFAGAYTPNQSAGMAGLSVTLNISQGGFTISSLSDPTFTPITGNSFSSQVPAGSYQITFSDVLRYYKPAPQKVVLNSNDSVTVNGLYQRLLVVAFTGFDNAPNPSNCFVFNQDPGSLIEYTIPQTGAGMTELLPEIQGVPGVPALKPGITGAAFTFYGTDGNQHQNGNACAAPVGSKIDHFEAEDWLAKKNPTIWDKIVVIGHSYGGNRARLFVEQLKNNRTWLVDQLITVDAINWAQCDLYSVISSADPFSAAAQACNQNHYTIRDIPSSSARSSFSFYQTTGVIKPPPVGTFPVVMGYIVPGALSQQVTTNPIDHLTIDKDANVHVTIGAVDAESDTQPFCSTDCRQPNTRWQPTCRPDHAVGNRY